MTPHYYLDEAGTLYRVTWPTVATFSRSLSEPWAPMPLPLREDRKLYPITRLRARLSVWRRQFAYWRFVRAVGAK